MLAYNYLVTDFYGLLNDIALLRLSRKVILGPDANVVCLPGVSEPYNPATCTIIGWGETRKRSFCVIRVMWLYAFNLNRI